MRLGIDFDNTIVNYDSLVHRVGREEGLIPEDVPPSRLAVRNYLREAGQEDRWTQMQGKVYGARMAEAEPYPGVIEFLAWARGADVEVAIISHKTKHPFRGPRYDLPAAARDWIDLRLRDAAGALVPLERVFFEETQEAKLRRIAATGRACFIDDLPEILLAPEFPAGAARVLFDPEGRNRDVPRMVTRFASWDEIRGHVEERCRRPS